MSLTKHGIVLEVAKEMDELTNKQIMDVLQLSLDAITRALVNGDNVELRNFGVFEVISRKARIGRNPRKPSETTIIPPRRAVKFHQGKAMKMLVDSNKE